MDTWRKVFDHAVKNSFNLVTDNKYHDRDTAQHLIDVFTAGIKLSEGLRDSQAVILKQAAALHDVGKYICWDDETKTFRGHESASDKAIAHLYEENHPVRILVRHHGYIQQAHQAKNKSFKRFLRKLENNSLQIPMYKMVELFYRLALADAQGFSPYGFAEGVKRATEFNTRAIGLMIHDSSLQKPAYLM